MPRPRACGPHEQVLEVDSGLADERREVVEEEREAHRCAIEAGEDHFRVGPRARTAPRQGPPRVATTSCSRRSYTASSRMKASTSGISCSAAGRMVTVSGMVAVEVAGSGCAFSRCSAGPGRCRRRSPAAPRTGRGPGAPLGAPALQQVHLHEVHRIDVGVAQLDRALQCRIGIEQLAAVPDGEHLRARRLVLGADVVRIVAQRLAGASAS